MGLLTNLIFVSALLFASRASSSRDVSLGKTPDVDAELSWRHEQWMAQHGRVYRDESEKQKRFQIFKKNVAFIEAFNNADEKTYELAVNKYADLTNEEIKATNLGYRKDDVPLSLLQSSFKYENVTNVPLSVDWRKQGAVTPIKLQGNCGSCWAFSAVAAVEGITAITSGELIVLSEQELVDCVKNCGCQGGWMVSAFDYIKDKGLSTETGYPYEGIDGTCNVEARPSAHITGYERVPASESALMQAVAHQPVSVAIDASASSFGFYKSGVYTGPCGMTPNHGVTVVGYGEDADGTKYWLVKNSWGTGWGDGGYVRMERGVGLCGITTDMSYPTA